MDDQSPDREGGQNVKWFTSTPRERIFAVVLFGVYIGGWVLAVYADSHRIEDHWPARVFWVAFATWYAMMLVLPLVAVCWFFGGRAGSPAWFRGRFSLRALLIVITLAAVVFGLIAWAVESK
jgi:hypothetical protein